MNIEDGTVNWGDDGPKPVVDGFDMEARKVSIYEWVRQVRGGVLVGAFTVERHLGAAITYFMLGDRANRDDVLSVFDETLVAPLTFDRRIKVIQSIAPHFIGADDAKSLQGNLNDIRTTRNAMAHKPFWFHPELNANGEVFNLVPMIQRGKSSVALTGQFIEKLNEQISDTINRTSALAWLVAMQEAALDTRI